jgi:hypothetical protein
MWLVTPVLSLLGSGPLQLLIFNVRCIIPERVTHTFSRYREPYTYFIDMKYDFHPLTPLKLMT